MAGFLFYLVVVGGIALGAGYLWGWGKRGEDSTGWIMGGMAIALGVYMLMTSGESMDEKTIIAFVSIFLVAAGMDLYRRLNPYETENQRRQREMFEKEDAAIIGDAFDPRVSDSVLPKRANRDVWDEYYDKLVALNGCGPTTAKRIIKKVQADQELTNREQNFWNEVN